MSQRFCVAAAIFCSFLSCASDDKTEENKKPIARFSVLRTEANTVDLDASDSEDLDADIVEYKWNFGDGSTGIGQSIKHVYNAPGCYEISLEVKDDQEEVGLATETKKVIDEVAESLDANLFSGFPSDGTLLPRTLGGEAEVGTIAVRGSSEPIVGFETLFLRVFVGDQLKSQDSFELCGVTPSLSQWIMPVRENHKVELVARGLGLDTVIKEAERVVAGDFILVNGQSNAFSREFEGSADENLDEFVRSYGSRTEDVTLHEGDNEWHQAVVGGLTEFEGAVGQWPLRMASQLSKRHGVPIALINGARGGSPIDYFQKNDSSPMDSETNYGRLLSRVSRSGGDKNIRAILYYQGETDRDKFAEHKAGFTALHSDWLADFPSTKHVYVTQIRQGCGGAVETRNVQREFSKSLDKTTVMTTTGLDGHDGCHFSYENGYKVLGDWYADLLSRDLFGAQSTTDIEAIDVESAELSGDTLRIKTKSDASVITVDNGVESDFVLEGGTRTISSMSVDGTVLVLELSATGTNPTAVSYNGHPGPGLWIKNAKGVGLLAFKLDIN